MMKMEKINMLQHILFFKNKTTMLISSIQLARHHYG